MLLSYSVHLPPWLPLKSMHGNRIKFHNCCCCCSKHRTTNECVLNEHFSRAGASRSEPEHNHQTCFVLSSYHGPAVQQSLVTIWFEWKLSQGRKVGSTLAIQTAVFSWTRLACLACSCGHSSGGLLWCARHTHRKAPPACPGAWPRSSYLTSQIKLKNHLNMRLILRVGYLSRFVVVLHE